MPVSVTSPLTASPVSVPRLVTFGCAAVDNVPTNAVDVIEVAPVTRPASTLFVQSRTTADQASGVRLCATVVAVIVISCVVLDPPTFVPNTVSVSSLV
mgnify:CR=1 FL=1